MPKNKPSLYEEIGEHCIRSVICEFYARAFRDGIIGHFFMHSDQSTITQKQIHFSISLLGGPTKYTGKSLRDAHLPFSIRKPHFDRRQVLMQEVLNDFGVEPQLAKQWLELESQLQSIIVNTVNA